MFPYFFLLTNADTIAENETVPYSLGSSASIIYLSSTSVGQCPSPLIKSGA